MIEADAPALPRSERGMRSLVGRRVPGSVGLVEAASSPVRRSG